MGLATDAVALSVFIAVLSYLVVMFVWVRSVKQPQRLTSGFRIADNFMLAAFLVCYVEMIATPEGLLTDVISKLQDLLVMDAGVIMTAILSWLAAVLTRIYKIRVGF